MALEDFVQNLVTDAVFTTHRSGTFYTYTDYLILAGGDNEIKIPYPCQISVNGRRKVVVTEVDGLLDTVKEDMGFSGYDLNISFEAGDYRKPLVYGGGTVKANDVIKSLTGLVRNYKGEVSIVEGAKLNYEETGNFMEEMKIAAQGMNQIFRQQESPADPQLPLLSVLEISKVVLQTLAVNPIKNHRYQVTLTAVAELDTDEDKLFQEDQSGGKS